MDECDLVKPCDEQVSCQNEEGGFVCGACPPGFTGSQGWRGAGKEVRREVCVDIDECSDGRHTCNRGRLCVNTLVSLDAVIPFTRSALKIEEKEWNEDIGFGVFGCAKASWNNY